MSKGLQDTVYLQNNIKEVKREEINRKIFQETSVRFALLINKWRGKKKKEDHFSSWNLKTYLAGLFPAKEIEIKVRNLKTNMFQKSNVRIVEVLSERFTYEICF